MTSNKPKVNPAQAAAPDRSNSLADLAARIRTEHEAVSTALAESVQHAMAAGALLIEAKEQIPHGGWLPWLRDHCAISERTAQLYMRTAKNRKEIENQIRNGVADLSLNEATAILMLTSNVKKLINFARELERLPRPNKCLSVASPKASASSKMKVMTRSLVARKRSKSSGPFL